MSTSEPEQSVLLDVVGLSSGYGRVGVLHDVNMSIQTGEVVALLGPNGAGKTTLLRTISGVLNKSGGRVSFAGRELPSDPRFVAAQGLAHVVEGHRIFTQLTVADNLLLAAYDLPKADRKVRLEEALDVFPEIGAKRNDKGGSLSGGQQQMLAVAQGLVKRPKLLMLDEPSAGLSPALADRVLAVVQRLRDKGVAVLLVEQVVEKALAVSNRMYALAQGRVVLTTSAGAEGLSEQLEAAYFGGVR